MAAIKAQQTEDSLRTKDFRLDLVTSMLLCSSQFRSPCRCLQKPL